MSQTVTNTQTVNNPDGSTTVTTTYSDGTISVVWTPAAGSPAANAQTLLQRAQQALANNATFLANASPTNAQIATQVKALTRQINGVIRLLAVNDTSTITDS